MGEGKILIVDDDDNTRNAYNDLFEGYGFETGVAGSISQALEILNTASYEAVLMDLRVSNDNLLSIGAQLKKEFSKTFLVIMIVDLNPAMVKRASEVGIDECLGKPLLPFQLIATIKKGILRYRLEEENRQLLKKLQEVEAQNQQWLMHDVETGAYNTKYFNERLEVEIKRAQRHEHWLSILICELMQLSPEDNGKERVASLPDEVIKLLKILSENIRDVDIIGRYKNGFGIILPETNMEGSNVLCGRLKKNMNDLINFDDDDSNNDNTILDQDVNPKPPIRFGMATYPLDSHLSKRLLKIAEDRLQ